MPNAGSYLGSTNAQPLLLKTEQQQNINFYTNAGPGTFNGQHMTIIGTAGANQGFIGMNNTAPIFNLTISTNGPYSPLPGPYPDGGLIAFGQSGSGTILPNGLRQARMIWYPRMSAFRAGDADAPLWDDANIGLGSACFGLNTRGIGAASFAAGNTCYADGETSVALGKINFANGAQSVTIGCNNTANNQFGVAIGSFCTSSLIASHSIGIFADAQQPYSKAYGNYVQSIASNAFVIGSGVGNFTAFPGLTNYLTNNISNSIMIGMNSINSSIFVESGNGAGLCGRVGFNNTDPQNLVEINAQGMYNPALPLSGLRLRKMRSTSTPVAPNGVALSVDAQGDVILVQDAGGVSVCAALPNNYITKATAAAQICDSRIWENATADRYVGIGNFTPTGKLHIVNDVTFGAGTTNRALFCSMNSATAITNARGGEFIVQNGSVINHAVHATSNAISGVLSAAEYRAVSGFACAANASQTAHGGHFEVTNCGATGLAQNLIGVFASVNPTSSATNWAAWFIGSGMITASTWTYSDSTLKQNITDLKDASAILMQLNPKTYDFDTQKNEHLGLATEHQYGLLAQEVENVLPAIIKDATDPGKTDENGNILTAPSTHKAINYTPLISILIQGFKEQQAEIVDLKSKIGAKTGYVTHQTNVTLSDIETIILDQNEPNPFAEETNINYFIPESAGKAEIMFYTNDGRLINKVEIKERGQGTLHIYASDLSSGIYTYTLMVNGKVVETKKMMKSK
nr:tail fiber domain-containing protein [Bacteroidota bacterium]